MTERTAAELEVEAEAARAKVTNTAESIKSKMSPGQLIDEFSGIFTGGDGAATLTNLKGQIRDNPLPLTLIGAGLAWLMLGTGTSSSANRYSSASTSTRRSTPANGGDRYGSSVATGSAFAGNSQGDRDDYFDNGETGQDEQGMVASAFESATSLVSDAADATRSAMETAKGAVSDAGERIAGATGDMGSRAADLSQRLRQSSQEVFQREPLVLAALGLAVGTAIGAMLPGTSFEDDKLGGFRDKLRDSAEGLIDKGVEGAKEVAAEAYETIKDEADRQGLGGSEDTSVVEQVGKIVKSAAEKTEEAVRERISPA